MTHKVLFYHWFFWYFLQSRKLPKKFRKFLLKKFAPIMNGPFDVKCNDIFFRIYPEQNYDDRHIIRKTKLPEYKELTFLQKYLCKNITFIDIGANIGTYSLFVAKICNNNLNLFAFEPNKNTYKKLLFNLTLNNINSCNIFNYAISNKIQETHLWLDGNNDGANSLLPNNKNKKQKIQTTTLLNICQKKHIKKIDLLKIDVEGFEDKALLPFFTNAPKNLLPKIIVIETLHKNLWQTNLINIFLQHNYKKMFATKENEIFFHPSFT